MTSVCSGQYWLQKIQTVIVQLGKAKQLSNARMQPYRVIYPSIRETVQKTTPFWNRRQTVPDYFQIQALL